MALEVNKVGSFNGKSFLGSNSAKPICGHFLRDLYRGEISQAKIATDAIVYPGCPVTITNTNIESGVSNAGKGLNPNVLSITGKAAATADVSGFVLESPTDILQFGEEAARPYKNQVVNVALLGSRVEVYLPADASLVGVNVGTKLAWDFTDNVLKVSATGTIDLLSPVVDGVSYIEDNGSVVFNNTKCVKVRL